MIKTKFTSEIGLSYMYDLRNIQYIKDSILNKLLNSSNVLIMFSLIMTLFIQFTGVDTFYLVSIKLLLYVYIDHLDPNCF